MKKVAVVAVGGNALIREKGKHHIEHQFNAVRETAKHFAKMVADGWDVVVTHGNGPQVGFILRRAELSLKEVHPLPLDIIGAHTQGSIGYMLQQSLGNEFHRLGIDKQTCAVVTQSLVDKNDPAFQNPTKGIGGYIDDEELIEEYRSQGWTVEDDAGRGFRRKIASPKPLEIVETKVIKRLVDEGVVVIAVGGGGIPVIKDANGDLSAAPPAVIDKDRGTALLAMELNADIFVITTAVEKIAINFNTPDEKWLDQMTVSEAKRYMAEGHFKPGSMLPKVEAMLDYVETTGNKALVTDPDHLPQALKGETGTWIVPDKA